MTRASGQTDISYRDCADWLVRGPYSPCIDTVRVAGGISLVRGIQPAGRYPDPPFSDYSLILTTAGCCRGEIDFGDGRRGFDLRPGSMVVAPTNIACDYEKYGDCETLVLGLPKSRVSALAEQATGQTLTHLGRCHEFFQDPLVEVLCQRLWQEAVDDNPYGKLFVDQAVDTILTALLVRCGRKLPEPKRPSPLSGERLQRVVVYISEHLADTLTLAELAAVAHMSEFHFARVFKLATGAAPHQYLIARRVDRAKQLIGEGRMPLAQVASAVGFSSQSHLSRHFKTHAGCSPAQYRN